MSCNLGASLLARIFVTSLAKL
uniref:Uncharacterized protein n=1 Tax=Arundo donax TaxID=35708 RepID=A0A0A9BTE0_ARUDO